MCARALKNRETISLALDYEPVSGVGDMTFMASCPLTF